MGEGAEYTPGNVPTGQLVEGGVRRHSEVHDRVLTGRGEWSRSRRLRPARLASTRRSTWSSWAWAPRARRRSSAHDRRERTCWPSNGARFPEGRRPTPAGSSTWGAARPCRAPVASRTRRRTWRRSSGPPSGPAWTTIAWTSIAKVRRTTLIGWSRSACRSGRRSATNRTANPSTTPGCSSAAVRTPTRSTRSRSRPHGVTSRSTSTPPAASSWNASVLPCRPVALVWRPIPAPRHSSSMTGRSSACGCAPTTGRAPSGLVAV